LLKKFVTDLSHSTNSDVRLEGLYLAMALSPRDPEGTLEEKEKELLDAIWSNRDRFFSGEAESSLLPRTEWMLKRKYSYDASENPASFGLPSLREEPFLSFQDHLRKDFLARAPRWEGPIFGALFTTDPAKYDEAQAREFIPLLEEFRKRLALKPPQDSAPGTVLQVLKSRISSSKPPPSSTKTAPVTNPTLAQQLQVIRFTDTNLKLPGLETWPEPAVENAVFRFGKLWLQLRYSQRGAPFNVYHTVYLGADIKTGKSEAIPFPAEFGHPDPTTAWSKTRFFSAFARMTVFAKSSAAFLASS
jgi:hypothetical protein